MGPRGDTNDIYEEILTIAGLIAAVCVISLPVGAEPIVTESTSNSTVKTETDTTTTVKSAPPSAISPSISGSNSDLCTVGVSGAVQTQILGVSTGQTYRDANCERLKLSKTLYDMGMKVAAVSVMCQDRRVFDAMAMGTPCPTEKTEKSEKRHTRWKPIHRRCLLR